MRNRLIGAIAAVALMATGAGAGDFPPGPCGRPPCGPPPPPGPCGLAPCGPPPWYWTGPYVGANLGYQWGSLSNSGAKPNGVAGGLEGEAVGLHRSSSVETARNSRSRLERGPLRSIGDLAVFIPRALPYQRLLRAGRCYHVLPRAWLEGRQRARTRPARRP